MSTFKEFTHVFTHPEVVVEGTIVHELHDNHGWLHLRNNSIQLDDIGMIKLTHNGRLSEEVILHLIIRTRLKE